jgi:hypothetical protein
VDALRLGVTPNSIQQDGLPDPTQAHQHRAFRMPADAGTLKRHPHVFEKRIAAGKLDWWRARARHKRVSDGVHATFGL